MKRARLTGLFFLLAMGPASYGVAQDASQTPVQELPVQELPAPASAPASGASAGDVGFVGLTADLTAPDGKSVFVEAVAKDGPAAKSGLKAGDIIVEVNGQEIPDLDALSRVLRQAPGTKLLFKVRRKGVPQRFEVTLAKRAASPVPSSPGPSSPGPSSPGPSSPGPDANERTIGELPAPASAPSGTMPAPSAAGGPGIRVDARPSLGIRVADAERLSDADKRRFGVVVDSGAVISGITPGAPAALAGLPLGGVVVSVNGKRIGSAQDIVDVVRTFQPGDQIELTYWEGDRMGRKKVRVGRGAVTAVPSGPSDRATSRPPLGSRLRRRGSGERPILNALERVLDGLAPPSADAGISGGAFPELPPPQSSAPPPAAADSEPMVPPPPPPRRSKAAVPSVLTEPKIELPPPRPSASREDAQELETLHKQASELQRQLDALLKRIEQLENKNRAPSGEPTKRR